MEGDVLLFGGPYSNLRATEALLEQAQRRGIARERRICTGDAIGYAAEPAETFRLVVAESHLVAGNCERQVGEGAADCGCGFEEGTACDALSKGWYPFAAAQFAEEERAVMRALPDICIFLHRGARHAVLHGGYTDISRFLWPDSPDEALAEEIAALEADVGRVDAVVAGHSGIAFQRRIGEKLWINAGAIGLPPHDGRPLTRYAILSDDGVRFERLAYDHAAAAGAMRAAGLDQGYDRALETGIWPSEDVLPAALRR